MRNKGKYHAGGSEMQVCTKTHDSEKAAWTGEFALGVRDTLPLMLGVFPFGVTFGMLALGAGLSGLETLGMSLLVFAGAAQFFAVLLLGQGVHSWSVLGLTTLLVNLRHLLMGASLAPQLLKLPFWQQALLTFGMADETYAVTVNRRAACGYQPAYQWGSNATGYATWALSTLLGVAVGSRLGDPLAWGLDIVMPATFLAMLMPRLRHRPGLAAALTAAVVSLLGALCLPGKWYLLLATIAAALVGGCLEGEKQNA